MDEDEAFEISTDLYCTGSYLSESYEDYFGEIPPPPRFVPGGEGSRYIKVHRGLYFVAGPNDWYLAAGVEAASNLTLEAKSLGQRIELSEQASNSIVPMEWIFFSLSICARPVCEFYCNDVFKKDMGRFITSWPDLLRVVKMGLDTSWKQKVNSHEFLKLPGLY